jgi:hypothetical protein
LRHGWNETENPHAKIREVIPSYSHSMVAGGLPLMS